MREQLISFETAKLAKEKGFSVSIVSYYTPKGYQTESEDYQTERLAESNWNDGQGSYPTKAEEVSCSAPTQSLLQKWLREKYREHIKVTYVAQRGTFNSSLTMRSMGWSGYETYEEALEKGLQEALKLIRSKPVTKIIVDQAMKQLSNDIRPPRYVRNKNKGL